MVARDILDAFVEAASERMADAVQQYYDVVDQFGADSTQALIAQSAARIDLERAVRENHLDAATIGSGGDVSYDAERILKDIVDTDTYYVERFADDLPKLSRAQALVRSNMYVDTQRNTITEITALEITVLPIYPRDDRLICTYHCTCDLDIRFLFGAGNADVYWRLDEFVKEACEDCIRLAASWNPLQIRGGQIVSFKSVKEHDIRRIKAVLDHIKARVA